MQNYTNAKIRRAFPADPATTSSNKSKHRVVLNESANRKYEGDALKSLTRKSIDVTLGSNKPTSTTYYQSSQGSKPYYRRGGHNFKKQSAANRYEEEEREKEVTREKEGTRVSSKSPYVRGAVSRQDREAQGKNSSSLNKSTHKMRSGQLIKQNSPRYLFYRQPRSSLSQHYDPSIESSLHKRRTSAVDEKSSPIEEAKELYKNNEYSKAI
jgi:tetratricopeptide (TPR) repeat protein